MKILHNKKFNIYLYKGDRPYQFYKDCESGQILISDNYLHFKDDKGKLIITNLKFKLEEI
jgi:hypothetical protein